MIIRIFIDSRTDGVPNRFCQNRASLKNSQYFLIFLIFLFLLIIIGCQKSNPREGAVTVIINTLGETKTESYNTVGISIYELLIDKHEIKLNYGKFLECLDTICSNKEYSWAIYVNDEKINAGITIYIIKDNDTITLAYE